MFLDPKLCLFGIHVRHATRILAVLLSILAGIVFASLLLNVLQQKEPEKEKRRITYLVIYAVALLFNVLLLVGNHVRNRHFYIPFLIFNFISCFLYISTSIFFIGYSLLMIVQYLQGKQVTELQWVKGNPFVALIASSSLLVASLTYCYLITIPNRDYILMKANNDFDQNNKPGKIRRNDVFLTTTKNGPVSFY